MKLLFKQRFFSWFDSYDIYDENGNVYFTVKGKVEWGHLFYIYDANGNKIAEMKQHVFRLMPRFDIIIGGNKLGEVVKEFSLFKPKYRLDFLGWSVEGDWIGWNYTINDVYNNTIASISKEILHMTDTYVLDITKESDALRVLVVILAIDAANCSRNSD